MADIDTGQPVRRDEWAKLWATHGNPDKPPSRGAVAGWLWGTARPDGTHASASVPFLAAASGYSQATVKRVLRGMRSELWVALRERGHYRGPNKDPTANVYDLTARPELVDPVPTAHPGDPLTTVDNPVPTAHPGDPLTGDANSSESAANSSPKVTRPCSPTDYPWRARRRNSGAGAPIPPPGGPMTRRTSTDADTRDTVRRWLETLRGMPQCPHGVPGGDQHRPDSGEPQCPLCRHRARAEAHLAGAPPRQDTLEGLP